MHKKGAGTSRVVPENKYSFLSPMKYHLMFSEIQEGNLYSCYIFFKKLVFHDKSIVKTV